MDRWQSIELLNATHVFPCEFTFKAIGSATDDFSSRILTAVNEGLLTAQTPQCTTRSTPKGRHVSVTIVAMLGSAEEVLDVYDRMRLVEGIVMTL